mgnify:CR=1 FL=1
MPGPAENRFLLRKGVEYGVNLDRLRDGAVPLELGLLLRVEYALPFRIALAASATLRPASNKTFKKVATRHDAS